MKSKEKISDRLKEAMTARNMRAVDLARTAKVSTGYLSRILSGDIENPSKHVKSISEALRVSESWLQFGTGPTERGEDITLKVFSLSHDGVHVTGSVSVHKDHKGCEAYICNISSERYMAIVNKSSFGSGLFVINDGVSFTVAIRIDTLNEIEWSYFHREGEEKKFSVIGKVIKLWRYEQDESS